MNDRDNETSTLLASDARSRALLDIIPLPTFLYDVETLRILAANEAALLSYGYSREEFLAMTIADVRPPEELPRLFDEVAKVDAGTRSGRWLHRRKNGEIFDVQVVSQDAREPGRHVRLVIATDVTEQRRAERALRENEERLREGEERFRIAFQSTPDAISIGRLEDGINVAVNGGYCRLSGYTEAEVVGHTSLQLDLWVDPEQRASLIRNLHAKGAVRDAEVRIRRKDRSEFDALLSSEVFKSGGRAYFLTVTREVTERKRSDRQQAAIFRIAEAANREGSLQEMLREIHHIVGELMHAPNFYIALYDAAAQTLSFPYYEDEHGDIPAGPEELGNGLTAFVLRKGQPLVLSDRAQFVALAAANEVDQVGVPALSWVGVPLISKRRTVGVLAAQIYSGTARYGQAEKELLQYVSTQVAHSIERKQDQETLRASEQRFRALIENSSDGISLLAADGEILYRSPAMAPMLGLAANAPHGNLLALLHPEDVQQMQSTLVAVQRKPAVPVLAQARVRREDGSIAVLEAVVTGLLEDPAVRGIVLNVRDVSDRKQMEAKLMMADRMVSVGTLAAGVAHEINNPLAYVLANLGFLDDALKPVIARGGVDRDVVEALQEVQAGAERVRNIVRDLKTFSRADEFCDAPVDVHRVLDAAANMAHNEVRHRARLVKDYATRLPLMTGNESRLGQVFLNLIINAAQAIPEGAADRNEIRVATRLDGERIIVEIKDSGAGISPDIVARLFDPFFTTKPVGVGTGLGLFICQNIVNAAGGDIAVESKLGAGATFRVSLPLSTDARSEAKVPPSLSARAPRARILVVDDELLIGVALRRGLPAHEVVAETSALSALELLRRGERFDVILCDVMMPEMTGANFYDVLQTEAKDVAERIVFMTGGAFTPAAREFLERVPNVRLEKPLDLHNVRALISERMS